MGRGEPGLPASFTWRGHVYVIEKVLTVRKGTGTDRGDVYVRRHYYDIETSAGERMTIYCDRHAPRGKHRWWLYTMEGQVDQGRPLQ